MAKVTIKGLTKIYGENTVVNRINLEIPNGMLVSILGPSGCGKTTTLRMIAGFEQPEEGEIYFDEERITDIGVNKRNIGMVFQSYALFPHMTVAQNIAYGLEQRKFSKEKIHEKVQAVLKLVHMEPYADRKPKQLSGGQQQRVALARALVIEPRVLLLDECLSALDKKLRVEMQAELRKILEETGVTTFFVTHDQEEAMTLSDYIVVMNNGLIEQIGTPFEVYERPKNQFVASFLGKANFFKKERHFDNGETDLAEIFAVRPEKITVSKEKNEKSLKVGKVDFITYSGNITTYAIEVEGSQVLAEIQNASANEEIVKGDMVHIGWEQGAQIPLEV
ncbi:ABC transporter ATP-binding protein [Clostridium aminobutyricum]|uniref:ABC-type quaternary amine transporter n=1 Tax=Clostridium aminobutyricum TaxID=33953 RepID=A0A939D805_CLOAM|nr:ABC transporter ATP-binding protein [Clostridium aminobutyricum]MBN7772907.1 ABC transporter ATP-binding protein [Clostridium aminobutyricum]